MTGMRYLRHAPEPMEVAMRVDELMQTELKTISVDATINDAVDASDGGPPFRPTGRGSVRAPRSE